MHRVNEDKAQILTDIVQSYGGSMLRSFLGRELGEATVAAWGARCLSEGSLQNEH